MAPFQAQCPAGSWTHKRGGGEHLRPSCWGPSQGGPGDFLPLPWPHLFVLEAVQGGSATCQQARPECVVPFLNLNGFII